MRSKEQEFAGAVHGGAFAVTRTAAASRGNARMSTATVVA